MHDSLTSFIFKVHLQYGDIAQKILMVWPQIPLTSTDNISVLVLNKENLDTYYEFYYPGLLLELSYLLTFETFDPWWLKISFTKLDPNKKTSTAWEFIKNLHLKNFMNFAVTVLYICSNHLSPYSISQVT